MIMMEDATENDWEEEKKSTEPLEIDDKPLEDASRRKQRQPEPQWFVILRYVTLSSIAVGMTLTCPGDTKLWQIERSGVKKLDLERVAEVILVYVVTLLAFFWLNGSDPGYLTSEAVTDVSLEDGLSLMGYEQKVFEDVEHGELSLAMEESSLSGNAIKRRSPSFDPLQPPSTAATDNDNDDGDIFHGTRRKVCETCRFAPPLRAHHCKICNKCVATYDHHCSFTNSCVGERNHCRFWWFLTSQAIGFIVCCSVVNSSRLGLTTLMMDGFSWQAIFVVAAKVYLYPLTTAAIIMVVIHSFFAFSNTTTFECTKGPRHLEYLRGTQMTDLPFSRGLVDNLQGFCCQRDAACDCLQARTKWTPKLWHPPGKIVRDSEDWWEHPWQNKYWSCC